MAMPLTSPTGCADLLHGPRRIPRSTEKSAPRRVLVVDDEALIRWSLVETLTDRGCEVSEAADGRSALAAVLADENLDVAVLDLRLPDSPDLLLASMIRRLAPGARLILMTAYGSPDVIDAARALGVDHIVTKPFEVADLADLVAGSPGPPPT
jgi:DNA-binding NtrC family response regulator